MHRVVCDTVTVASAKARRLHTLPGYELCAGWGTHDAHLDHSQDFSTRPKLQTGMMSTTCERPLGRECSDAVPLSAVSSSHSSARNAMSYMLACFCALERTSDIQVATGLSNDLFFTSPHDSIRAPDIAAAVGALSSNSSPSHQVRAAFGGRLNHRVGILGALGLSKGSLVWKPRARGRRGMRRRSRRCARVCRRLPDSRGLRVHGEWALRIA